MTRFVPAKCLSRAGEARALKRAFSLYNGGQYNDSQYFVARDNAIREVIDIEDRYGGTWIFEDQIAVRVVYYPALELGVCIYRIGFELRLSGETFGMLDKVELGEDTLTLFSGQVSIGIKIPELKELI